MYSYKMMNGGEYVIHNASGCSLPYHSKASKYKDVPDWKRDVFSTWIKRFSNSQRRKIKQVPITQDNITMEDFMKAKRALEKANVPGDIWVTFDTINTPNMFQFAPLPKAVPVSPPTKKSWNEFEECCKYQEGKTPMRYNETNAYASVSAPKSDISTQREYLLNRLENAFYSKDSELEKFFNLHIDNSPKNFQELIDAIKGGKYTIDKKAQQALDNAKEDDEQWYSGPLYGFVWEGLQADYDGYHAARDAKKKQKTVATDVIMTGDAAAGLAALQAFEAWMPTVETKAN
jgi:hypothetical protein